MARREEPRELRFNEQFARIGKALGSPKRIEILQVLCQGERSVEALAQATGTGLANTSGHLQVLRRSGLVETRKEGTKVFYSLADDDVARFFISLRELARSRLAEVEMLLSAFREDPQSGGTMTSDEVLEQVQAGTAQVVDVRPTEEFEAGHIWGAVSIPLDDLGEQAGALSKSKQVVVYSRGPYCPLAFEAAGILSEAGVKASRLDGGFPEWRLEGKPIVIREAERAQTEL